MVCGVEGTEHAFKGCLPVQKPDVRKNHQGGLPNIVMPYKKTSSLIFYADTISIAKYFNVLLSGYGGGYFLTSLPVGLLLPPGTED